MQAHDEEGEQTLDRDVPGTSMPPLKELLRNQPIIPTCPPTTPSTAPALPRSMEHGVVPSLPDSHKPPRRYFRLDHGEW
jgi:hypothetical protein